MNSLIYDRRAQALICVICLNIAVIVFFIIMNKNLIDRASGIENMLLIAGTYMAISGNMDIIRNIECLRNVYILAIFKWLIFVFFTVSVIQHPLTLIWLFKIFNLATWWVLLYVVIEVVFWGDYYDIRTYIAPIFLLIIGLIDFFSFIRACNYLYCIIKD